MKDTTAFLVPLDLMKSAACSSTVPPISPIMMMPSVCGAVRSGGADSACGSATVSSCEECRGKHLGVVHKALQAIHEVSAVEGVAADAHHRGLAKPHCSRLVYRLSKRVMPSFDQFQRWLGSDAECEQGHDGINHDQKHTPHM